MALDHKLRFIKVISFQVVDVDGAVGLFFGHHGGVLPGEEVLRALGGINLTVEWAELEPIELRVYNNWGLTFYRGFLLLTRHYCDGWLAEVAVPVDFDVVGFLALGGVRYQPEADLLIRCEDDGLQTLPW